MIRLLKWLFLGFILLTAQPGWTQLSPYYGITQNSATGRAAGHISGTWGVAASSQAPSAYGVFLDGVNARVGIGTASPLYQLDLNGYGVLRSSTAVYGTLGIGYAYADLFTGAKLNINTGGGYAISMINRPGVDGFYIWPQASPFGLRINQTGGGTYGTLYLGEDHPRAGMGLQLRARSGDGWTPSLLLRGTGSGAEFGIDNGDSTGNWGSWNMYVANGGVVHFRNCAAAGSGYAGCFPGTEYMSVDGATQYIYIPQRMGFGTASPLSAVHISSGSLRLAGTGSKIIFPDGTEQSSASGGGNTSTIGGVAGALAKYSAATELTASALYDSGTGVTAISSFTAIHGLSVSSSPLILAGTGAKLVFPDGTEQITASGAGGGGSGNFWTHDGILGALVKYNAGTSTGTASALYDSGVGLTAISSFTATQGLAVSSSALTLTGTGAKLVFPDGTEQATAAIGGSGGGTGNFWSTGGVLGALVKYSAGVTTGTASALYDSGTGITVANSSFSVQGAGLFNNMLSVSSDTATNALMAGQGYFYTVRGTTASITGSPSSPVPTSETKSYLDFENSLVDRAGVSWSAANGAAVTSAQQKWGSQSLFLAKNGSSPQYITTTPNASYNMDLNGASWSVDFWVRFNTAPNGTYALFKNTGSSSAAFTMAVQSGLVWFELYKPSTGHNYTFPTAPVSFVTGQWYWLAVQFNAATPDIEVWLNGTKLARNDGLNFATEANKSAYRTAMTWNTSQNGWQGDFWLDEVRHTNTARFSGSTIEVPSGSYFPPVYSGSFGIHTTTPTAKLHIYGPDAGAQFRVDGTGFAELSPSGGVGYGTASPQAKIDIFNNDGALAALLRIKDSASNTALVVSSGTGYTALGRAAAEERLHVGGNIKADNGVIASTGVISGNSFSVGGSTLAVVQGKVGIGTAAPAQKLHVSSGSILLDGAGANIVSPAASIDTLTVNTALNMGLVYVSSSCAAPAASCTAACSSGKKVTGGGCQFESGDAGAYYYNKPASDLSGWGCSSWSGTIGISAYAICAKAQ